MEATVAERGQITLPKAVRDALGLTKGSVLKVELDGGRQATRVFVSARAGDGLDALRRLVAERALNVDPAPPPEVDVRHREVDAAQASDPAVDGEADVGPLDGTYHSPAASRR